MRRSLWGALLLPWLLLFCHSDSLAARIIVPTPVGGTVGVGGDHMLQTQAAIRNALNDSSSFCLDLGSHTGQYGKQAAIDSVTGLQTRLINLSGFSDFTLAFSDSGYGRLRVDWIVIDPTDSTMSVAIDTIYLGQTSTINQITRVTLSSATSAIKPTTTPIPCYGKLWFRSAGNGTGPSCLESLGPLITTTRPVTPLGWQDSFDRRDIRSGADVTGSGNEYSLTPSTNTFTTDTVTLSKVGGVAYRLTYVNNAAGTTFIDENSVVVHDATANNSQFTNSSVTNQGLWGYWCSTCGPVFYFNGTSAVHGNLKYGVAGEDWVAMHPYDDPYTWRGGYMTMRSDYDIAMKADSATNTSATMLIGCSVFGYWNDLYYADFNGTGTYGTKPIRPQLQVYARVSDGAWFVRTAKGDSSAYVNTQLAGAPTFTKGHFAPYYNVHINYTPARTSIYIGKTGDPLTLVGVIDSTMASYPKNSHGRWVGAAGTSDYLEGMGLKWFAHSGTGGGAADIQGVFWNPVTSTYRY